MNRGIPRSQIRPCANCQGPLTAGLPLFWRVSVERLAVDPSAVRTVASLETYFPGHPVLANVFAGDPVIAKPLGAATELLLCERCALDIRVPVAALALLQEEQTSEGARADG
jgi:hypothetical protein